MASKIIILFNLGDQQGGWSEVLWSAIDSIPIIAAGMTNLLITRASILSPANKITGFRITSALIPAVAPFIRAQRTAQLFPMNVPGSFFAGDNSSDVGWTGAMVRYNSADGMVFRNQILRGVPDSFFSSNSDMLARLFTTSFIPSWLAQFALLQIGIYHFKRMTGEKSVVPVSTAMYRKMTRRATGRSFDTLRGRR